MDCSEKHDELIDAAQQHASEILLEVAHGIESYPQLSVELSASGDKSLLKTLRQARLEIEGRGLAKSAIRVRLSSSLLDLAIHVHGQCTLRVPAIHFCERPCRRNLEWHRLAA
jgi:multidrug resistance protein MdtO